MEQSKITLDYEISLQEDIPLSATDKCALFGNLMDNAIEGCSKVTGDRKISLKVTYSKGCLSRKYVIVLPRPPLLPCTPQRRIPSIMDLD